MECYVETKESDCDQNQTKEDALCAELLRTRIPVTFGERCPARVVWFLREERAGRQEGYFLDGRDDYAHAVNGKAQRLMNIHEMQLVWAYDNVENVMAAIAIGGCIRTCPMDVISCIRSVSFRRWSTGLNLLLRRTRRRCITMIQRARIRMRRFRAIRAMNRAHRADRRRL